MAGREINLILRDAAIGCLIMALVFRWFWAVVIRTFHETARHKRMLAEKAEAARTAAEAEASQKAAGSSLQRQGSPLGTGSGNRTAASPLLSR